MKIRTLIVAATALTAASTFALAQSSPSPANQSGGGVTNTQAPTDQGAAGVGGNTRGAPTPGANQMNNRMAPAATTGSSTPTPGSAMKEGADKTASPASSAEGANKQK